MLPPRRVRLGPWTLAAAAIAAGLSLPGAAGTVAARGPAAPAKVAVFGIDAADWRVIDPLVAAGRLPAFARLKQVGSLGVLRAGPPLLSPLIWTTMATGRPPEEHAVLDFMVDVPGGGQAPVTGGARRVKALWEIWSEAGRAVQVTGWWATWPADRVRGLMASDRVASPHVAESRRLDAGLVFPPSLAGEVTRRIVEASTIDHAALERMVPTTPAEFARAEAATRESAGRLYGDRIAHFRAAVAAARSYRRISVELIPRVRPDFWAVYYEVVDTASHLFARDRRGDAAVAAAYREVDQALADTVRTLEPDTLVVVVSDHGFQPADAGIAEDPADFTSGATAWHRPYGIIGAATAGALAGTAPPAARVALGVVSPLDIAPTLLARAGLPVAADMPGRVLAALAPAGATVRRIPSHGAHLLPEMPANAGSVGAAELDRLRALGYVSGAKATTSLARVNLGEILFRKGDLRGAARELEAVLRQEPLNARAAEWLARAYIGAGRRDDALAIYDRLIRGSIASSGPLDALAVLAATDIDVAAGRLDAAQARLDRLPAAARRMTDVLVSAGAVAEGRGRAAAAEQAYRDALAGAPSHLEALQRLMGLLLAQHRAPDAAAATAEAARPFPSSPSHLSLAGEAALAARRHADAERFFRAALSLAPDSEAVRLDLARAQLLAGKPDAALESLRTAAPSREGEMLRGAAHSARREWAAAIAAFDRALAIGPPSTDILNSLAAAQLGAGRKADAARSLERSLALDPEQPAARALLQRARTP